MYHRISNQLLGHRTNRSGKQEDSLGVLDLVSSESHFRQSQTWKNGEQMATTTAVVLHPDSKNSTLQIAWSSGGSSFILQQPIKDVSAAIATVHHETLPGDMKKTLTWLWNTLARPLSVSAKSGCSGPRAFSWMSWHRSSSAPALA